MDKGNYQYSYQVASNYDKVQQALDELEDSPELYLFRKRDKPRNTETMDVSKIYLIEAIASKLSKASGVSIYPVDIAFIIWLRDYEYVSRGFTVKSLGFLTIHTSYKFFARNKKNKLITEVRTRTIGVRNGSAFYLSPEGEALAKRAINVLKNGTVKGFSKHGR